MREERQRGDGAGAESFMKKNSFFFHMTLEVPVTCSDPTESLGFEKQKECHQTGQNVATDASRKYHLVQMWIFS